MTVLERDVTGTKRLVLLPIADKCETVCYVAENGGLDFDGLDIHQHQDV